MESTKSQPTQDEADQEMQSGGHASAECLMADCSDSPVWFCLRHVLDIHMPQVFVLKSDLRKICESKVQEWGDPLVQDALRSVLKEAQKIVYRDFYRTIQSVTAQQDLVATSEREVIAKAKAQLAIWRELPANGNVIAELKHRQRMADAQCELLAAVTLLESNEAKVDRLKK